MFSPQELPWLEIATAISCLSVTFRLSIDVIYDAIDDDYRLLITDVANGSSYSTYSHHLKSDFDNLSVLDGLVLMDSRRIVLSLSVVRPIIRLLHASHSGINKTLPLARGLYYWPERFSCFLSVRIVLELGEVLCFYLGPTSPLSVPAQCATQTQLAHLHL